MEHEYTETPLVLKEFCKFMDNQNSINKLNAKFIDNAINQIESLSYEIKILRAFIIAVGVGALLMYICLLIGAL